MGRELIYFHRGLAYDARSALQDPGFLQRAVNITFNIEGTQELRPQYRTYNNAAVGAIHSIKRFVNNVIIGDGAKLERRSTTHYGNFSSLGSAFGTHKWTWREYKDFLFGTNGTYNLMIDTSGNVYNCQIDNPASAPSGTGGAGGNPDGTYKLYVSYYITFPNGHTYETGLSDGSSDVTVTNDKITWSGIPTSSYSALYGTEPTIHRKLYRGPGTGGTLADIYYVATLSDNTTTTYSDDFSDATLGAHAASIVDDYDTGPLSYHQAFHYGRWFIVDKNNPHRLYYSEAVAGADASENEDLLPLAFPELNFDDLRTSGINHVDPQGLIGWGSSLYIPLKHTWLRKDGNDPDSWSYKKTWAKHGIAAPDSLAECSSPAGILGVATARGKIPALSLFNGQMTQIISGPKLDYIFEHDMNHDAISECRGRWDGRYYHLLYPSGENEYPDKWLAIDLSRFPEVRAAYWEDLNANSLEIYDEDKQIYVGGHDGYMRINTGTEAIDVDVQSHDLIGGKPELANTLKKYTALKYNLDTGGDDVTLELYLDGIRAEWEEGTYTKTISGTGDAVQVLKGFPQNFEAYMCSVRVYGTALNTFTLYSPWTLEFE